MNKKNRRSFAGLTVLYVIGAALETVSISAFLPLASTFLDPSAGRKKLLLIALAVFLLFVGKNAYLYFVAILKRRYILRRFRTASEQLLKSYLELPYPFHLYQNSAALINNINIHTDNYYLYWQALMDLIKEGTMAVGVFALLCFINPTATLAAAAVFTLITVLMKRFIYPRVRHLTTVSNDAFDKMHITVSDALQSVKEVKTYSVVDRVKAQYARAVGENVRSQMQIIRLAALPSRIVEVAAVACLLLLLLLGKDAGLETDSLSRTAVLVAGFIKLLPAVKQINELLSSLAKYKAAFDRGGGSFLQLLREAEDRTDATGEQEAPPRSAGIGSFVIRFDSVDFRFENGYSVFDGVDLTINSGEVVGLKGPSGAGKSTFINLMLGLLAPTGGRISVIRDGETLPLSSVGIGYIPQDVFIMDASVKDNVLFFREYDREKLETALRLARLEKVVAGLEHGVDTVIGERGVLLSGGQNQRIIIARALYDDPRLLLMDEATSSLDSALEREIMDDIYSLRGDRTIVISAHRLSTLEKCDRVFRIENNAVTLERERK